MDLAVPTKSEQAELARITPEELTEREGAISRAADAYKRLTVAALRMTYPHDWQDFGGQPYLEGEGAMRMCSIGIKLSQPNFVVERVGEDIFVECEVTATWAPFGTEREFYAIGACDTLDKFMMGDGQSAFNQALELAQGNVAVAKRKLLATVKKKAHSNAVSRAITGVMGIKGLKFEDLEAAGVSADAAGGRVNFAKGKQAKRGTAASKKSKTPDFVPLHGLYNLAMKSHASTRGTIASCSVLNRRHEYVLVDGGHQITVKHWTFDAELPANAVKGAVVFFADVEVGEYQGTRQYSSQEPPQLVDETEPQQESSDASGNAAGE